MRLFIYLSEILGRNVIDVDDKFVGKICDISMRINEEVFPRAISVIVQRGGIKKEYAALPIEAIQSLGNPFELKVKKDKVSFASKHIRSDFSICRDILDQQVVDTNGQKVVRVNDVQLLRVDQQLYLAHVDVGLKGIVRRLGWAKVVDALVGLVNKKSPYLHNEELISWKNTHVINDGRTKNVIRSDVARKKLAKIPVADLADIMEDLDVFEKISLFKTFTVDMQRKIFAEMTPQEKEEIIDQMQDLEAANLLENIPADEATDFLHTLQRDRMMALLRLMHSTSSKKLRKLLGFKQDSAGGLMTTEYVYVKQDALVRDAMDKIKRFVDYPGNIFHVYIVDQEHRLVGATSLRRFINEDPQKPILETAYPHRIFVKTDDGMEEVALLLEKHKFSSIPVLNENDVLQGVITSDDVMEELISLIWTKYKDQL
ncbi:MAG: magnesium transporter [Candidatus Omnitrophica bacterium]|nr:magnesium transporter [Candidatus Omnitrophota bacterium]